MLVWGQRSATSFDGARYDPMADTWRAMPAPGQPLVVRDFHFIWTGQFAVVWSVGVRGRSPDELEIADAGRYDPAGDRWLPVSGQDAPRFSEPCAAAWTGTELLVWGEGQHGRAIGGRYDPHADVWRAMRTDGAPRSRTDTRARWTGAWAGRELVVWTYAEVPGGTAEIGRYDPNADRWLPASRHPVLESGPDFSVGWTGMEVLIWADRAGRGARYAPASNSWRAMADQPAPRTRMKARSVWTGRQLVIWGGVRPDFYQPTDLPPNTIADPVPDNLDVGGAYDPVLDTWHGIPPLGRRPGDSRSFLGRTSHSAVWTGSEMIVWGGANLGFHGGVRNDGARWRPST